MYWIPNWSIFSRTCLTSSARPAALTWASKSVIEIPLERFVVGTEFPGDSRPGRDDQLHGNGLLEVGCSLPSAKREKRDGSNSSLGRPQMSSATSWPTPIIL